MKLPVLFWRRAAQLMGGITILGFSSAFLVRGDLGSASWDVLTQGITHYVPLTFGTIGIITSFVVLLLWIPLKQKLGIGTVVNVLWMGIAVDYAFTVIPVTENIWIRILYVATGILLGGLATGIYIGARFGTGPRDGLMTGLNRVTGLPIWLVRTALEVTVVAIGWLLGGVVGVSTVAFALLIGPVCQYFMGVFHIALPSDKPEGEDYDPEELVPMEDGVDRESVIEHPAVPPLSPARSGARRRRTRFAAKPRNG